MKNNRIQYIDFVKGIAILLVILGHVMNHGKDNSINQLIYSSIYSFHMPLFFIISGYFLKRSTLTQTTIVKNIKALLIPYLVMGGVMCIWQIFHNFDEFCVVDSSCFFGTLLVGARYNGNFLVPFIGPIWFLPVLFNAKMITIPLIDRKVGWVLITVLAVISITLTKYAHVVMPFGIQQACIASLFLMIGYSLRKHKILDYPIPWYCLILLLLVMLPFLHYFAVATRINSYHYNILSCFISSGISIVVIKCCKETYALNNKVYNRIKEYITLVGKYSLVILCVHTLDDEYHWLYLPSSSWMLEFIVRTTYIIIISFVCIRIPFIKKIFNIQ